MCKLSETVHMSNMATFVGLGRPRQGGPAQGKRGRAKRKWWVETGAGRLRAEPVGPRSFLAVEMESAWPSCMCGWDSQSQTLPKAVRSSLGMSHPASSSPVWQGGPQKFPLASCCLAFPSQGSPGDEASKNPSPPLPSGLWWSPPLLSLIKTLLSPRYVTLDKSVNHSVPQFPHR